MRLLGLIMILIVSMSYSQDYDISKLESMDFESYLAGIQPNPNEYYNNNKSSLFNKEELRILEGEGTIAINIVIDFERRLVLEMFVDESTNSLPKEINDKLIKALKSEINVSPRKLVSSAPDVKYIMKSFFINGDK